MRDCIDNFPVTQCRDLSFLPIFVYLTGVLPDFASLQPAISAISPWQLLITEPVSQPEFFRLSTSSIGQPGYLCHAIPPSENRLAIETMAIVVSSCRLCPTGGPQISPQLDTKGTFHRRLRYCVGLQQSWSRPDPSSQVSRTCEKMVRG